MTSRHSEGSRAFAAIGVVVMLLGLVHVGSAVILYGAELVAFARGGFAGLYDAPAEQVGPFWSVLFGVMVLAAGQQIFWAGRRHRVISIVPGFFLLAVGLVGAWYVPVAPFWVAAALGAATTVLVVLRRTG